MISSRISGFTFLLIAAALLAVSGCKITLSGASTTPEMKTITIQYFPNNASLVQPTLSQALTEALKERVIAETSLQLVDQTGDLSFEGEITNYAVNPVAIQQNETAAMNRLTVTIRIKFTNNVDDKLSYETNFTRYEDYLSTADLTSVEETLIASINEQLVEDMFNKAFVNW
ncbi:MAG: LptE family protein [Flavobacteriales bacterium]|nr:LptE family protein [Flavobacteriales bacterium]